MASPPAIPIIADCATHGCPALRSLGFSDPELAALRQQGFMSRERRRPEGIWIYKLRYRVGGRQRTRYLGRDLSFIEAVRNELAQLQAQVKRHQTMRALLRRAARTLRRSKATLAPLLSAGGYHYHGLTIRQRRKAASNLEGPL